MSLYDRKIVVKEFEIAMMWRTRILCLTPILFPTLHYVTESKVYSCMIV